MRAIRATVVGALWVTVLATSGCGYNTIQTLDEQAAKAKQNISVQLQRRADLIPNLVETVKGYAKQESEVYETVAKARGALLGAVGSGDIGQMATTSQQLNGALGRLLAISENYPQLKSNETFMRLMDELTGTENRVGVARTDYNNAVNEYNTYIRRFPQVLTAKVMGMKPRDYFEAAPGATAAPKVDFGTGQKKAP